MKQIRSTTADTRGRALILLVILMLAGLPFAVWLDLRNLTETSLLRQAKDLNSVVSSVRGYYASNVVGRVLASPGSTQVVHNYESIPGAIPIPATLSLELGRVISEQQQNISYRFVSDFPFKNRAPHALDNFETRALAALRNHINLIESKQSNSGQLHFEDSDICCRSPFLTCRSSRCVLMDFVPEEFRSEIVPCPHIPLNQKGESLEVLYCTRTTHEIESVVRGWLSSTIETLQSLTATKEAGRIGRTA